jgi:hypothetical protein
LKNRGLVGLAIFKEVSGQGHRAGSYFSVLQFLDAFLFSAILVIMDLRSKNTPENFNFSQFVSPLCVFPLQRIAVVNETSIISLCTHRGTSQL